VRITISMPGDLAKGKAAALGPQAASLSLTSNNIYKSLIYE